MVILLVFTGYGTV